MLLIDFSETFHDAQLSSMSCSDTDLTSIWDTLTNLSARFLVELSSKWATESMINYVVDSSKQIMTAILAHVNEKLASVKGDCSEVMYIYWLTVTHCAMHSTCYVQVTRKGRVGREVRS